MTTGRLLARGSFARVLGTVAAMGVAFFLMPFLVRSLGDRIYGLWTIVAGFAAYYYLLDLGFAAAASRYMASHIARKDDERVNELVNTSLVLFSTLGACIIVATLVICYFARSFVADPHDLNLLRVVIVVQGLELAFSFPFKAFGGIVFAHLRYDLIEYFAMFRLAVEALVTVYFVRRGYGLLALAVIGAISHMTSNFFFYGLAKWLCPTLRIRPRFFKMAVVRELSGYGVWSFLITIADNLRFKIDNLVVGGFTNASHVTHFNIGGRLAEYFLSLISKATNLLIPVFTRYHALEEREELRSKFIFLTKVNATLAFFGGGQLLLIGHAFIQRWMGAVYVDAYPVLVWLVVGAVAEATQQPANSMLFAIARHRFGAIVSMIEGLANLGLSIVLVLRIGFVGVAAGTAIPAVVTRLFIIPVYTCRQIGLPVRRFYAAIAPIALTTGAYFVGATVLARRLLTPNYGAILLTLVAVAPVYAAAGWFLFFDRAERALCLSVLPRSRAGKVAPP